jgi:hypothetical protein
MSGTATAVNYYSVSATNIAFGTNTCGPAGGTGTPPPAQTVTLSNTSSSVASWTACLGGANPSFFGTSASCTNAGAIPAGTTTMPGTATLSISALGLGSTSGLTAAEIQQGLSATVTVNVGTGTSAETFAIQVSESPVGAFPSWSPSPLSITTTYNSGVAGTGLGSSTSGSATFNLVNAASAPTAFTLAASPNAFTLSPTSGSASASSSLKSTVSYKASGNTAATGSITATVPAGTPLCGPLSPLSVSTKAQ